MIHLLVVDPVEPAELSAPANFELLWASGAEEAAEKLARNRRIDAVLFFDSGLARETAKLLESEDPAFPPLYLAGAGAPEGIAELPEDDFFSALLAGLGEA
jgi:hypothetical protein